MKANGIGAPGLCTKAGHIVRTRTFDAALLDINLDDAMSRDVDGPLSGLSVPFVFDTGLENYRSFPQLRYTVGLACVDREPFVAGAGEQDDAGLLRV